MSVKTMASRREYIPSCEGSFRSRHSREEEELEEQWRNWNDPAPSDAPLVQPTISTRHRSSDERADETDLRPPRFQPPRTPAPEPPASASLQYHYKPYPRLSELPDNIDTSFEYGTLLFGPSVSSSRRHRYSRGARPPAASSTRPIERRPTYSHASDGGPAVPRSDFSTRSQSDDYHAYTNNSNSNNSNNARQTTTTSNAAPSTSLDRLLRTPPDRGSNHNNTRANHQPRNLGTRNDSLSHLSSVSSLWSETNPNSNNPRNHHVPGAEAVMESLHYQHDSPEQDHDGTGAAEEAARYYQERIRPSNRFDGPPRDITIVPQQQQQQHGLDHDPDPFANLYPKVTTQQKKQTDDDDIDRKKGSSKKKAPPPFSAGPPKLIEISPGTHVHLRGAVETWQAVQTDFYTPCPCFVCRAAGQDNDDDDEHYDDATPPIFCIQDAEYVLCPRCKSISPLDATGHGVGLGFTMETLAELQADIFAHKAAASSCLAAAQPLPPAQLASHRDDDNNPA